MLANTAAEFIDKSSQIETTLAGKIIILSFTVGSPRLSSLSKVLCSSSIASSKVNLDTIDLLIGLAQENLSNGGNLK